MTYRELRTILNLQLTPDQLDQEVSIAVIGADGVEVHEMTDFVDPNDEYFQDGMGNFHCKDAREATYLDEINGSILDKGHAYMTVVTQ